MYLVKMASFIIILTLTTIIVYSHITNDKNHFNGALTSFPNQNTNQIQTSKNPSLKVKNTMYFGIQITKSDLKIHDLGLHFKY
jgi:hypothetical protein